MVIIIAWAYFVIATEVYAPLLQICLPHRQTPQLCTAYSIGSNIYSLLVSHTFHDSEISKKERHKGNDSPLTTSTHPSQWIFSETINFMHSP